MPSGVLLRTTFLMNCKNLESEITVAGSIVHFLFELNKGADMIQKFHKYNFCGKEMPENLQKQFHKIKVSAKRDGDEIYLFSANGSGSHSVYLQDRFFCLNVDSETKNVCAFEGDIIEKKLHFANLIIPQKIKDVVLCVDTKENMESGCGSYLKFEEDKLFYDKQQKLLQIGSIDEKKEIFRFIENGYAQIKNKCLVGLIFSDIEL